MFGKYTLNSSGEPVLEPNLMKWARWVELHWKKSIVKQEWIDNVRVSTVFLTLDHNYSENGTPVLWETMTFSNRKKYLYHMERCSGGREQAEAMHEEICALVRAGFATKTKQQQ